MKIVFLGPPGVGKGTQAKLLAQKLNHPYYSTGDFFRENIRKQTDLGKTIQEYIQKGELVPDELVKDIIKNQIEKFGDDFILDGYPRTVKQAEYLTSLVDLDHVVNFTLEKEKIIERIGGRRTCPTCGRSYHVDYKKPRKENYCDVCLTGLVKRADESKEAVKRRLEVYEETADPIVEYYKKKELLAEFDASGSISDIHKDICRLFDIKKHILIIGAPGSGKGSQAKMLAEILMIPAISVGQLLRDEVSKGSEIGKEALPYMEMGEWVPHDLTFSLLKKRLDENDTELGFVIDAFPRLEAEAHQLGFYMADKRIEIDAVINLKVPDIELLRRINSRAKFQASKGIFRPDSEETITLNRIALHHETSKPILEYYKSAKILEDIDGTLPAGMVHKEIIKAI